MVPTVSQQLRAIRHTLAKTVIPALDPNADFAQEQAGLVLASLDWALDVVGSEHHYEVVERAEYRALLDDLLALDPGDSASEARKALEETAAIPAELTQLRTDNVNLKRLAERMFVALTDAPGTQEALAARQLLTRSAKRQSERELSWARMTGFPGVERSIGDVLASQASASQ
jgi:hypothetical protein